MTAPSVVAADRLAALLSTILQPNSEAIRQAEAEMKQYLTQPAFICDLFMQLQSSPSAELRQLGDATAGMMLQSLKERRPRIRATIQAVRTWRKNYLWDSAHRISSVDELEARRGEELRGNLQVLAYQK